jgi:hypothetical protein
VLGNWRLANDGEIMLHGSAHLRVGSGLRLHHNLCNGLRAQLGAQCRASDMCDIGTHGDARRSRTVALPPVCVHTATTGRVSVDHQTVTPASKLPLLTMPCSGTIDP